jgi:hypothetical protein
MEGRCHPAASGRDGLSFFAARRQLGLSTNRPSLSLVKKQRARRAALAATLYAYAAWKRRKFIAWTDEYRALMARRDALAAQYHDSDCLSEEEARQVEQALGQTYDRLAILEHELDLLTYDQHELSCVRWWKQERQEEADATRDAA